MGLVKKYIIKPEIHKELFILYFIYKICIELIYVFGVNKIYAYLQFGLNPSFSKYIVSVILLLICVALLPNKDNVSSKLCNIFFATSFVPADCFYWLAGKNTTYIIYMFIFVCILFSLLQIENPRISIKKMGGFSSDKILLLVFLAYGAFVIFLGFKRGGIDRRALSFKMIYDLRKEGDSLNILERYSINWCCKAIFPCLLCYYLSTGKKIKSLICVLLQLFAYLCFGFKAYLFSILFVIVNYYMVKKSKNLKKDCAKKQVMFYILMTLPCFLVALGRGLLYKIGFLMNSNFAMRMLYESAKIKFGYYDYFSTNNKLWFSEGLIGKIFDLKYEYSEAIGFVITRFIMNDMNSVSNSNTGIMADAFANAGLIGIVGISILTACIFRIIDSISINTPHYVSIGALSYLVILLNDNAFLTSMLTNGWFISIIMLLLVNGAYKDKGITKR